MAYVSSDGTVKEKNALQNFFATLWAFLAAIVFFFQSLLGLDQSSGYRTPNDHRNQLRRTNAAGGGRYVGAALDRGNGNGGGVNRRIGGLPSASGIAPPPMGGCCGGGGCG